MEAIESTECVESMEDVEGSSVTAPFILVKEAVTVLPVSKGYLYNGLRKGSIPGTKFGRARALLRAFVDEFIARVAAGEPISFEDYAADWYTRNSEKATV